MQVIHQVEVQRKGGPCAAYPSSCIVRDLLNEAGLLKPFEPLKVLDLTYGQGIFYYSIRSRVRVYAFDIRLLNWIVKPYMFYEKSCEHWKRVGLESEAFDLVVVDPPFSPYNRGWEKRGHYRDNGSIALCMYEALKASEHFNVPLLVHFFWKTIPYGYRVIAETWFQGWSRLSKMPRPTWFGILERG
ncbi:MAG: hypothetical protein F7C38_06790 [Desulfurococcales archaeon]|nr:hypothetical protein [Desulfurococcales archaeon]